MAHECFYFNNAKPIEEDHDQRELKTKAKTNRQKQDETKPLTDSGIGVETKPFVKCKKVCEYEVENKKECGISTRIKKANGSRGKKRKFHAGCNDER